MRFVMFSRTFTTYHTPACHFVLRSSTRQ